MIIIKDLFFSYPNNTRYQLRDINMEVSPGDYVSIIGDNGSGKTTLMRVLLGFLKPVSGSVQIGSGHIGYVPQKKDLSNNNFPITVFELLDSYGKLLGIKNKKMIYESLKVVGMEAYKKTLVGNLSGGQMQKVFIARALIGNPELLVLDEPSTGIDVESQMEIYKILKELNTKEKKTVIAVEHNLDAVVANSTRIFHLKNGYGHFCNIEKYAEEYLNYKRKE